MQFEVNLSGHSIKTPFNVPDIHQLISNEIRNVLRNLTRYTWQTFPIKFTVWDYRTWRPSLRVCHRKPHLVWCPEPGTFSAQEVSKISVQPENWKRKKVSSDTEHVVWVCVSFSNNDVSPVFDYFWPSSRTNKCCPLFAFSLVPIRTFVRLVCWERALRTVRPFHFPSVHRRVAVDKIFFIEWTNSTTKTPRKLTCAPTDGGKS